MYTPEPQPFTTDALTAEKFSQTRVAAQVDAPYCVCIHTPPQSSETLPGHSTSTRESSTASWLGLWSSHSGTSVEKHYGTCLETPTVHADSLRLQGEPAEVQRRLEFSQVPPSSGIRFRSDCMDGAVLVDSLLIKSADCHEDDAQSTAASSSSFGPSHMSGKRKRGDEPQRPQLYLDELCKSTSAQRHLTPRDSTGFCSRRSAESGSSPIRETSIRTFTNTEVQTDPELCIESSQPTGLMPVSAPSQLRLTSLEADSWKPGLYLALEECTVDFGQFLGHKFVIGSALGTSSLAAAWGAWQWEVAGAVTAPPVVVTSAIQDLAFTGEPASTAILGVALLSCCVLPTLPSLLACRNEGLFDPGSVQSALRDDESVAPDSASTDQVSVDQEGTTSQPMHEDADGYSSPEQVREPESMPGTTPAGSPDRSAADITSPSEDAGTSAGTAMEAEEARSEASTAIVASELDATLDAAIARTFARAFYFVDNTLLRDLTLGLGFRSSKHLVDKVGETTMAPWGCLISGIDEGDGWVRVADWYLPKQVRDITVLKKHEAKDCFVWMVDNSILKEVSEGLAYQSSRNDCEKVAIAPWGSRIYGKEEDDSWVRVGNLFLPRVVRGQTVLVKDTIHIWLGMPAVITSNVHQLERSVKNVPLQWPSGPSGRMWEEKLGQVGDVTEVDLSDNTVSLDKDVGWVPITALVGFEDWPPCNKQVLP